MEVHLVENEISSQILKLDTLQNDHFMANASAWQKSRENITMDCGQWS